MCYGRYVHTCRKACLHVRLEIVLVKVPDSNSPGHKEYSASNKIKSPDISDPAPYWEDGVGGGGGGGGGGGTNIYASKNSRVSKTKSACEYMIAQNVIRPLPPCADYYGICAVKSVLYTDILLIIILFKLEYDILEHVKIEYILDMRRRSKGID